jgi:hypothetical protein
MVSPLTPKLRYALSNAGIGLATHFPPCQVIARVREAATPNVATRKVDEAVLTTGDTVI